MTTIDKENIVVGSQPTAIKVSSKVASVAQVEAEVAAERARRLHFNQLVRTARHWERCHHFDEVWQIKIIFMCVAICALTASLTFRLTNCTKKPNSSLRRTSWPRRFPNARHSTRNRLQTVLPSSSRSPASRADSRKTKKTVRKFLKIFFSN
jgi:hypothetical protein